MELEPFLVGKEDCDLYCLLLGVCTFYQWKYAVILISKQQMEVDEEN